MTATPLTDVSVVELSTMVAGPYAGQLLGDHGADVVKIERPNSGELARGLDPRVGGENGESFYYLTSNRNKRSLALDITGDTGRELFLDLAEEADVILENFPPAFTDKYDIDYEAVRERNETIVYCSISAYGETGPYRDYPGIDTTVQALSGAMSMTRDGEAGPLRSGVPMNDVFAAQYAVQGILTALYNRERTGKGDFVDVSLHDAGLAGLTTRATFSFVTGEPYPPFGRRHNYFAPEGVYGVADGEVQLSVVTDRHWQAFCEAVDAPQLAADERFETVGGRVEYSDDLEAAINSVFEDMTVDGLVEALRDAGVPVAPIEDTLSAFEDPQARSRQMRRSMEHPTAGEVDTIGFPVKYETIQPRIASPPPLLGEHTEEILSELGLEAADIERLLDDGVVSRSDE